MAEFGDLLTDNESVAGRAVTSAFVLALAVLAAWIVGQLVARRYSDPYTRYYARKLVRYVAGALTLIALAILWRAFAGRIGVVLGVLAAGIAFAMQEVIGALAGWFNIVSGRIFKVGDRVEMGGVRGDVIDITPLRTKVIEIGSPSDPDAWVHGRQYTGRIVALSNKKTFSDPVYNYSAVLEFIWEEIILPISHRDDWHVAETILAEEIAKAADEADAVKAMHEMMRRYPVPRSDVEPRVFVRFTDNWVELTGRFPVAVRRARPTKDEISRAVLARLAEAGITVASSTAEVNVRLGDDQR